MRFMEKVRNLYLLKVPGHTMASSYAGVIAFLILKDGVVVEDEEIVKSLKELVRKKIAAFAVPTAFVVCL